MACEMACKRLPEMGKEIDGLDVRTCTVSSSRSVTSGIVETPLSRSPVECWLDRVCLTEAVFNCCFKVRKDTTD